MTQEFGSFIYDHHMQRYGLKQVAEAKLLTVIESVHRYKSIKRIENFGRFMGLFEPLSLGYLTMFLEASEFVERKSTLGSDIPRAEYDEVIFVPLVRFYEFIKFKFEPHLRDDE